MKREEKTEAERGVDLFVSFFCLFFLFYNKQCYFRGIEF